MSLCGCGDESSSPLVNADAPPRADAGCVVGAPQTTSPRTVWPQKTWTVRPGDSLSRIARELYGDERLWKAIRDANPSKVGRDGTIVVGATLVVPFDGI